MQNFSLRGHCLSVFPGSYVPESYFIYCMTKFPCLTLSLGKRCAEPRLRERMQRPRRKRERGGPLRAKGTENCPGLKITSGLLYEVSQTL